MYSTLYCFISLLYLMIQGFLLMCISLYFRDKSKFSNALKSKHEENEAYLSEIEVKSCFSPFSKSIQLLSNKHIIFICYAFQTIGQAYDDMQNQNQHLLQQITERDDYNIKVIGSIYALLYSLNAFLAYVDNYLGGILWRPLTVV